MNKNSTTYELLLEMYKKPIIKACEAGEFFGISRKAVNDKICRRDFFLPTFKVGRYQFVRVKDLAIYIDNQAAKAETEIKSYNEAIGKNI